MTCILDGSQRRLYGTSQVVRPTAARVHQVSAGARSIAITSPKPSPRILGDVTAAPASFRRSSPVVKAPGYARSIPTAALRRTSPDVLQRSVPAMGYASPVIPPATGYTSPRFANVAPARSPLMSTGTLPAQSRLAPVSPLLSATRPVTASFSTNGFSRTAALCPSPTSAPRLLSTSRFQSSAYSAAPQPLQRAIPGASFARPAKVVELKVSANASAKVSEQCRLVDDATESPTNLETGLDDARFEFAEFQRRVKLLADEFYCSKDVAGMVISVSDLDCPSFHDELAAILLRSSLDRGSTERDSVVELLGSLHVEKLLTATQIVRAFEKLVLGWKDLTLDVPDAPEHLMQLLSSNWSMVGPLDQGLALRLPEDLLRAFSSGLKPGVGRSALLAYVDKLGEFKADLHKQLENQLFISTDPNALQTFAAWLRDRNQAAFHHEVLVQACLASLNTLTLVIAEQRRQVVLNMLVDFYSAEQDWLLDEVALQLGFSRLLGKIGDIMDDQPYCKEMVVALLRGAVEKDLLPPDFLRSARRMRYGGAVGVQVVREVQRLTPMHSRRTWGAGDARAFRTEIRQAISEYFDSRSVNELAQIVQELHLNDKEQVNFIRKLMIIGMERREPPEVALTAVEELWGMCWFKNEIRAAFKQLQDSASDISVDVPNCRLHINDLVEQANKKKLLEGV